MRHLVWLSELPPSWASLHDGYKIPCNSIPQRSSAIPAQGPKSRRNYHFHKPLKSFCTVTPPAPQRPREEARARAGAGGLMNRPALFFLALTLVSCSTTTPPAPAPVLLLSRPDAQHVRAELQPVPVSARWSLREADACGALDGPVTTGEIPPLGVIVLPATRAHLLTVTGVTTGGDEFSVSDCVPVFAWNSRY